MVNDSIGFVPTMGFLHDGHLSLVRAALDACDRVVVSIFVNPVQFGEGEDLEAYPRDSARDRALLYDLGVDEIWCPTVEEIYPEGVDNVARIEPPREFAQILCGKDRPVHFSGVATVLERLFKKIQPTDVYFGQKDYQQTRVVDWLIQEYFSGIRLHVESTVREEDGLAMSSRNVYLTDEDRKEALHLNNALQSVLERFKEGEQDVATLERVLRECLDVPGIRIQYAEIRDSYTLEAISEVKDSAVACIAAKIGKARLIDNVLLHV